MPIRTYTTSVAPAKTAGEIQRILAASGASRISIDYEAGSALALTFELPIHGRPMAFRLEPDVAGTLAAMQADRGVPRRYCEREQAQRVAWRIEKDWIDAQLAKIAAGAARLEQLLIGYAVTDTGETAYERLEREDLLGADTGHLRRIGP